VVCIAARQDASKVRAAYPREHLIRSALVSDVDAARTLASQWRATAISAGFVEAAAVRE